MHISIEDGSSQATNGIKSDLTNGHDAADEVMSDEEQTSGPAGMKCSVVNLYEGEKDRRGKTSWTSTYPDDLEEPPENAESAQHALLIRNRKCYSGRKK